jgi:hypothetical protein
MKYVAFIGTDGPQPEEAVAEMNRGFPAYFEEMASRGVRVLGRELCFPDTGATVRVREGETLVADGPFAETKEFVGGFNLLECADLDEAIEVESKSPAARFLLFEIRPFRDGPRLGPRTKAFGDHRDAPGVPYMLMAWVDEAPAATDEYDAWREEMEARDVFVLGGTLGGPETATTLRPGGGQIQICDGTFVDSEAWIGSIDVVSCDGLRQAAEVAATHPFARAHAIEVRPFYTGVE